MKGKLIVLEGIDGAGKSTQIARLCRRLETEGAPFHRLVFPQYEKPSSTLVRMYLQGAFGTHPADVNPYAASTFYAVDRYASYQMEWKALYASGAYLISDRYTTSNAIHQAAKLPREERVDFFRWLFAFEYEKLALPAPDLVIFLDMPVSVSAKLIQSRAQETGAKRDIHEVDAAYLAQCREAALDAAAYGGWRIVPCVENGRLRTPEEIGTEIDRLIC